ncbi:sialate O-acetylesterase [Bacteroides fluxus]|uniref:sialate O-acetylesterase n=1 Tax=Bacteroides fluxus TaxID=626930 RepID=UPI0023F48C1B|nr:sialate O-acetylesterase [Bacteroides fluxus]
MEKIFNLLLFLLLFQGVRAQDYDLYLCIGQSNMAGRGTLTEETSGAIPDVYLFNDRNEFEKATNPLNRYSTIRKELKMQGVGPAYSFAKTMATQTGRKIGLVVNARGGSSIQSNLPGLFFVAGEIASWASYGQASENIRAFNEMISHISDFIPNTACVSSEGLMPLIDYSDPHFCTDSQIVLGERYAQKVLENTSGLRVLFIGDSITDGNWGNVCSPKPSSERSLGDMNHIYGSGYMYLCASYYQGNYPEKEYDFFNRGISGNTLLDLEKRWKEDVIEMNPDVLSVLIGTNDIHHHLRSGNGKAFDFEVWEGRYRALLDCSLKANPKLKIILAAPFVANTGNMRKSKNFAERDSMVRRCAAIVERIAHDYHAIYLPYNTMFDELLKTCPTSKDTYWIWDGLHPTPAGHRRMADMWIERVGLL